MPTVLEQLRAAQRDVGIIAPEHPEQEVWIQPDGRPGIKSIAHDVGTVVTQRPIIHIREKGLPGGGCTKIFPPTFQSICDIPAEWIAENWTKPSPWCRMEGFDDHPEFEANLSGVER